MNCFILDDLSSNRTMEQTKNLHIPRVYSFYLFFIKKKYYVIMNVCFAMLNGLIGNNNIIHSGHIR